MNWHFAPYVLPEGGTTIIVALPDEVKEEFLEEAPAGYFVIPAESLEDLARVYPQIEGWFWTEVVAP